MSRRVAILAALPDEVRPFVQGCPRERRAGSVRLWRKTNDEGDEILIACAGLGAEAVRRAFAAAEGETAFDLVVSVGFAGATTPDIHAGAAFRVSEIVDTQTGERFVLEAELPSVRLATVPRAAQAEEKKRLHASYGAALVDMEAATVARLAAMRGVPMRCLKAVSDTSDAVLPEIDRFLNAEGQLRLAPFMAHVALHPRFWRPVAELARGSRLASDALAQAMEKLLSSCHPTGPA